jgi:hypothetical protein
MNHVLTVLVALTTICVVSAPVLAQGLPAPGATEKVLKSRAADGTNAGEVFFAPPIRWEYWCTCKCGDLYHRMDVPTPSCEDLNTKECVLDRRRNTLEDCARRLTPKGDRPVP